MKVAYISASGIIWRRIKVISFGFLNQALLSFEATSNAGGQVAEMVINYSSGEPSLASKSQERLRQTSAKSGRGQADSGFLSTEET